MKRLLIITLLLISLSATASASITYDSGTNTITVTGYTESTPCTFTDIYNADQSGGWGVVSVQASNQFYITANLYIGGDSTTTWFKDINVDVKLDTGSNTQIAVQSNAYFQLGNKNANGNVYDGCRLEILNSDGWIFNYGGEGVKLYDSYFNFHDAIRFMLTTKKSHEIIGCIFQDTNILRIYGANSVVKNVWMHGGSYFGFNPGTIATIDNVMIFNRSYGIYILSGNITARNIVTKNITVADIQTYRGCTGDINIIDSTLANWNFSWGTDTTSNVYRQYTFDLKVTDKNGNNINGATVKIWDKNDNLVVDTLTNTTGVIPSQTITRGYYNLSNGNNLQDYSPHHIEIEKTGYATYKTNFTIGEKTDWIIALQKSCNSCNQCLTITLPQSLFPNLDIIDQKCNSIPIPIYNGFNYISIPLYQYNTTLSALFSDHAVNNDTIQKYVNGTWNSSIYINGTWINASDVEPIEPFCGYEYDRAGDNFTLNVSGYIKSNIISFDYKTYVGTNIIRPFKSDKDD